MRQKSEAIINDVGLEPFLPDSERSRIVAKRYRCYVSGQVEIWSRQFTSFDERSRLPRGSNVDSIIEAVRNDQRLGPRDRKLKLECLSMTFDGKFTG